MEHSVKPAARTSRLFLTPAAWAALLLTAVFLAGFGGYLLGLTLRAEPYRVTTQRNDAETPEGDGSFLLPGGKINLNTADADQLQILPGIGPARAEAILADRAENGPYERAEDLTRVSGIGAATLAGLIDYITVEQEAVP